MSMGILIGFDPYISYIVFAAVRKHYKTLYSANSFQDIYNKCIIIESVKIMQDIKFR